MSANQHGRQSAPEYDDSVLNYTPRPITGGHVRPVAWGKSGPITRATTATPSCSTAPRRDTRATFRRGRFSAGPTFMQALARSLDHVVTSRQFHFSISRQFPFSKNPSRDKYQRADCGNPH